MPRPRAAAPVITPLSPERYRIQLTAGAELKRKLELSRDLLRHAIPNGDLATIIERALDGLIDKTLRRRFGVTNRPQSPSGTAPSLETSPIANPRQKKPSRAAAHAATGTLPAEASIDDHVATPNAVASDPPAPAPNEPQPESDTTHASPAAPMSPLSVRAQTPGASTMAAASPAPPTGQTERSSTTAIIASGSCNAPNPTSAPATDASPALGAHRAHRHVPNDVRHSVLQRDEARCTWRGPDGKRCDSQAWLEYDHVMPFGRGGSHAPANIRLFCRAHNRLAAEQAYGRNTIARAIARRHAKRTAKHEPIAPVPVDPANLPCRPPRAPHARDAPT